MDRYPFECPIHVRWRDMDAFAHVNNATVVTYLEMARTELWRQRINAGGVADFPFVIARMEIEYKRPIKLYDEVRIGIRAAEVERASFAFEYRIEANGILASEARTLQVCVHKESGRPVRVPPHLLPKLHELSART